MDDDAPGTYGDLSRHTGDVRTTAEPPAMPDPDECLSAASGPPGPAAEFIKRFDMRLDPTTAGWALGEPSRRGVIQGWLRMADGREPDPVMLLLAVDAFPPVTFDLGLAGWAPTLELSAHVRAVPAHLVDRLPPVGRLADDLEVRLGAEHRGEPGAHQLLVVSDDDPDRHRGTAATAGTGIRACTRKPSAVGPAWTSPP